MAENTKWQCTECGQVSTVGRCCGNNTRTPLNAAAAIECAEYLDEILAGQVAISEGGRIHTGRMAQHHWDRPPDWLGGDAIPESQVRRYLISLRRALADRMIRRWTAYRDAIK